MSLRILVTDGNYKHSLGIVRDLSRRGHSVVVCSEHRFALARFSRYCKRFYRLPPPRDPAFPETLIQVIASERIDLLIPVGYRTCRQVSTNHERICAACSVSIVPLAQLEVAADKWRMHQLAERLGVPTPSSHLPVDRAELRQWAELHPGPWVIKSRREGGGRAVRYAQNAEQLESACNHAGSAAGDRSNAETIVQQQIFGDGFGYFALYRHGTLKAQFMHHRIREYPVSGGPSCCAESAADEVLAGYGRQILDALEWHGVAMVEFKQDRRDGKYYLLEVNPKFWGSHDLALHCGVSFPALLAEFAAGKPEVSAPAYHPGIRYHWPWSGDWKSVLHRPRWLMEVLRDSLDPRVGSNLWWSDPLPNLLEMTMSMIPRFVKTWARRT